ncbi:MAG: hypothetical protein WB711_19515 [Terriglobales bacterium]
MITALHLSFTAIRGILFCVALAFWMLYFHEVLVHSERVRTRWLKKGLANFLLLVSMAIVTFLLFTLVSSLPSHLLH